MPKINRALNNTGHFEKYKLPGGIDGFRYWYRGVTGTGKTSEEAKERWRRNYDRKVQKDLLNIKYKDDLYALTLPDFFRRYIIEDKEKLATRKTYEYYANQIAKTTLGSKKITDLKKIDLDGFYDELVKDPKKSPPYKLELFTAAGQASREAAARIDEYEDIFASPLARSLKEKIKKNGRKYIPRSKYHNILVGEEFDKFLTYLDSFSPENTYFYKNCVLAAKLLLFTGLRLGECFRLEFGDVVESEDCFYLKVSKNLSDDFTKNYTVRRVPLIKEALNVLDELKRFNYNVVSGDAGRIFLNGVGEGFEFDHINDLSADFSNLIKRAGIDGVRGSHTFRRSFATRLYKVHHMSIEDIAALLGDTVQTTMKKYLQVEDRCGEIYIASIKLTKIDKI